MILVTGATGNVGAELVDALAHTGRPVQALTRDPNTVLPPGVTAAVGDLNRPDTLTDTLAGVSAVFLLPGYQDMPGLLSTMRGRGVERVVLLSGGSAGSGDMTNAISAYMIRSETAVRESGLVWTILRPTAFMSNALRWTPQLSAGDVVRLPFAEVWTATVDPSDIAAVAARALLDDGHHTRVYQPTGPESLRPADQVAVLADALDRDLRFEAQPDEEAREEMSRTTPTAYVDAFFDFYVAGSLDESKVGTDVQDVTGTAPRSFQQWAAAHVTAFR